MLFLSKNRHVSGITQAWLEYYSLLKYHGEAPNLHILDNECSHDLRNTFTSEQVKFQVMPRYFHRRNASERVIRTFKNHLITGICTCDSRFSGRKWDRVIPQASLTLNLLRFSRINPSLSAYTGLFGELNFNATPLASPDTKVLIHVKPRNRWTFGGHTTDG